MTYLNGDILHFLPSPVVEPADPSDDSGHDSGDGVGDGSGHEHTNGIDFAHMVQDNQMDRDTLRDCLQHLHTANAQGSLYWRQDQIRRYVADSDDQRYSVLLSVVGTLVIIGLTAHLGSPVAGVTAHRLDTGRPDSPYQILFQVQCWEMPVTVPNELMGLRNVVYTTAQIHLGTFIPPNFDTNDGPGPSEEGELAGEWLD